MSLPILYNRWRYIALNTRVIIKTPLHSGTSGLLELNLDARSSDTLLWASLSRVYPRPNASTGDCCFCQWLGGVHTTVEMAATVTFTVTLHNVKVLFAPITNKKHEQKQNGYRGFRTPLDHPFLVLAVLCRCQRLTNSTSKTLLWCFAPALPTQEAWITVSLAFLVTAVGSASFSRRDMLPTSSTSILGCT